MNTRLSGSARVDSRRLLPAGDVRGVTNFVKITEDVRKYAAEQGMSDDEALHTGLEQKSREFSEAGAEVYAKA